MSASFPIGSRSNTAAPLRGERAVLIIASGVGIAFAALFLTGCVLRMWIFDSTGRPTMLMDFLAFWSAGHVTLNFSGLDAYNPLLVHSTEVALYGHPFKAFPGLPWAYPPIFLFVAVGLALMPFATAYVFWNSLMLLLHGGVVAWIAKRPLAFFAIWALPWTLFAVMPGQAGVLSASLVGAVLCTLERRPRLSGILLGLLSFKPQFAVLFPIALAFGGYWRAFVWACIGTLGWTALSGAVFGYGCLTAFFNVLTHATNDWLINDGIGWYKMQSLYGLSRLAGLGGSLPWLLQTGTMGVCAVLTALLWRRPQPFALKAAGLAAAIPLVTPYAEYYDLPVLTIAFAFLLRQFSFGWREYLALALSTIAFLALLWHAFPVGPFMCAAVGLLIWWRFEPAQAGEAHPAGERDPAFVLPELVVE